MVSRIERGRIDATTVRTLDAVTTALSARLDLRLSWNGEALDRLLDEVHAGLVERVANQLRSKDWHVAVEVSFSVGGERGSIDVLALHPSSAVLLVVEVKSTIPDVQATLATLDRKYRVARRIAGARGWQAVDVARLLVLADSRTDRRRVARHSTVFDIAFPHRNVEARRWVAAPTVGSRFSGLWFLPNSHRVVARHRVGAARTADRA